MGACIALRSLIARIPISACAFLSPMWGINLSPIQRLAAWPVTWASKITGAGHKYAPGQVGQTYVLKTPFEDNTLTNDADMYTYFVDQVRKNPELGIGGPTMGWLFESLNECRKLSKLDSPSIPCLTFCGGQDKDIDTEAVQLRMNNWANGSVETIADGRHDLLSESVEIRDSTMKQILQLFSRAKP